MLISKKNFLYLLPIGLMGLLVSLFINSPVVEATPNVNVSLFNPGRLIDDVVFTDNSTMTVDEIQQFLEQTLPNGTCNRYQANFYNTSHQPPYTCLFEFQQNPTTKVHNYGSFEADGSPTAVEGGQSAAEIIWNASQIYNINPQVLLVLLQKEQSLITDTWPWPEQYAKATGYACPDDAACSPQFADFHNQIFGAAWQFRQYLDNLNSYWYIIGTNYIYYHPNTACGTQTVNIENAATIALYLYTPYVPNQAALDNLYGIGDHCSAYGNRNFWVYFNRWFGSPLSDQRQPATPSPPASTPTNLQPLSFEVVEQNFYADADHTLLLGEEEIKITVDQVVYGNIQIKNTGQAAWQATTLLSRQLQVLPFASATPNAFCHESWQNNCQVLGFLLEESVAPGETGNLNFILQAPSNTGVFYEVFHVQASNEEAHRADVNILIKVVSTSTVIPPPQAILKPPPADDETETETDDETPEEPEGNQPAPTRRPTTATLPDNWDQLTWQQKTALNPWGCHDTTKIRADNGRCLSGGYTIPGTTQATNSPTTPDETPEEPEGNQPAPTRRPTTATLPDNWDQLTWQQKTALNPWGCHDTTKIRADNGRCLSGGYTIPGYLKFRLVPLLVLAPLILGALK